MPIDSFGVAAIARELDHALRDSRIDKIHMPARDEIHLLGRAATGAYRLLLSGGSRHPRVHLTTRPRPNPPSPPMLCMLLRKHLTNGRFVGASSIPLERVLRLSWDATDEMGVLCRKTLCCELMGRNTNIILLDGEDRVIDALRRVDLSERPVLPGLFYRDPPPMEKIDAMALSNRETEELWNNRPPERELSAWMLDSFKGLSPFFCRSIAAAPNPLASFLAQLERVRQEAFTPILLQTIEGKRDMYVLPLETEGASVYDGSLSALLDEVYTEGEQEAHFAAKVSALQKNARTGRDKLVKKLALQTVELEASRNREALREAGDLLMANLHRVERGAASVLVEDFYHDNAPRTIQLDETLSPQKNAARLYKRYAKAKTAEQELGRQMELARNDIAYWDSVIEQLNRAGSEQDLTDIREELSPKKRSPREKTPKPGRPLSYRTANGARFRVGRNNRQNDELTFKQSDRGDLWLHAQKIPGSHVILENWVEGDEESLYLAAAAAAYHSGAKESPKVTVDYTRVKYVKKPPGAKPGMVIYDKFKSVFVEPSLKGLTEDEPRR